jgi:hypothetical protein
LKKLVLSVHAGDIGLLVQDLDNLLGGVNIMFVVSKLELIEKLSTCIFCMPTDIKQNAHFQKELPLDKLIRHSKNNIVLVLSTTIIKDDFQILGWVVISKPPSRMQALH